mgnify:CR=1 FL=1
MKAIILNLSAWAMLPVMDGFAKYLSSTLPVLQITWSRYFFTVVIVLPIMLIFFRKNLTWTDQPKLQLIRGLLLFCANILFFYSISIISLIFGIEAGGFCRSSLILSIKANFSSSVV